MADRAASGPGIFSFCLAGVDRDLPDAIILSQPLDLFRLGAHFAAQAGTGYIRPLVKWVADHFLIQPADFQAGSRTTNMHSGQRLDLRPDDDTSIQVYITHVSIASQEINSVRL